MDPDPELGNFRAGFGSGLNHSGSTTLQESLKRTFKKCFGSESVFSCLLIRVHIRKKVRIQQVGTLWIHMNSLLFDAHGIFQYSPFNSPAKCFPYLQDLVVEDLPCLENLNISCTKVNDISALKKCRERLKYLSMFGLKFPAASGDAIVSLQSICGNGGQNEKIFTLKLA